jgi:hypothetical protein
MLIEISAQASCGKNTGQQGCAYNFVSFFIGLIFLPGEGNKIVISLSWLYAVAELRWAP